MINNNQTITTDKDLIETIEGFIGILPEIQKEVIKKRYGLDGENPKTLEFIGQQRGVTRERIRQIELSALEKLKKSLDELDILLKQIKEQLEILGGIRQEQKFLEESTTLLSPNPIELWQNEKTKKQYEQCVNFLLDISPDFFYSFERPNLYSNWYIQEEYLKKALNVYKFVEHELRLSKRPLLLDEYQNLLRKVMREFKIKNEAIAISYLDLSKKFSFNPFGEFGLIDWEGIKPKNISSKAKLVLQKAQKPLHYQEILESINQSNFDNKKVSINTLHNELIKNKDFILVGRGIYALEEWGYKPGTIKDILVSILKKKPMTFQEILKELEKQRIAKEITVLVNLQDKNLFKKLPDKRYALVQSKKNKN